MISAGVLASRRRFLLWYAREPPLLWKINRLRYVTLPATRFKRRRVSRVRRRHGPASSRSRNRRIEGQILHCGPPKQSLNPPVRRPSTVDTQTRHWWDKVGIVGLFILILGSLCLGRQCGLSLLLLDTVDGGS